MSKYFLRSLYDLRKCTISANIYSSHLYYLSLNLKSGSPTMGPAFRPYFSNKSFKPSLLNSVTSTSSGRTLSVFLVAFCEEKGHITTIVINHSCGSSIINQSVTFLMNAHCRAVVQNIKMTSYHKVFELETTGV